MSAAAIPGVPLSSGKLRSFRAALRPDLLGLLALLTAGGLLAAASASRGAARLRTGVLACGQ